MYLGLAKGKVGPVPDGSVGQCRHSSNPGPAKCVRIQTCSFGGYVQTGETGVLGRFWHPVRGYDYGQVVPLLTDIKDELREHFVCLYVNARNKVIEKKLISVSSLFGIDCSPSLGVSGRRVSFFGKSHRGSQSPFR